MAAPRVCLLIDYQNIHLTAADVFAPPGLPLHESLIHPLKFAEQVLSVRRVRQRDEVQKSAELSTVKVYRGPLDTPKAP